MQDLIAFGIFELTALMQSGFALAINATCSLEATSQYERQGRGPLLSFSRKAQTTHLFVVHGLCPHSRAPVFSRRLYLNDICAPLLACFFFFRLFFSVFTFGLVVSTAGRAAYRGYIYFSWCSVRFHSRRRRRRKKKLLVMHVCWRCRRRHAHSSQAAPNLHEFISTLRKSLQALNSYTCSLPSLASLLNVSHFVSLYQR